MSTEYAFTHINTSSVFTVQYLDNHMLNVCLVYASLVDEPVEIKSSTSKQIKPNQNKTNEDPNNFNVEVLLNVIEFYCVYESIHVCIAACAHPSMQTPDEKCKCGAISKWIAVWTIYGCSKRYSHTSTTVHAACEESSSMCILFLHSNCSFENCVSWLGINKIHYKCIDNYHKPSKTADFVNGMGVCQMIRQHVHMTKNAHKTFGLNGFFLFSQHNTRQ